jgi:hypothetical protein
MGVRSKLLNQWRHSTKMLFATLTFCENIDIPTEVETHIVELCFAFLWVNWSPKRFFHLIVNQNILNSC